MAKPKIAAGMPIAVDLEPGSYWWCACGRSKEQPFCDGSHSGTEFEPLEFEVTEKKLNKEADYHTLVRLSVNTQDNATYTIEGTLFADRQPRIVNILGIDIDAQLGQHQLFVRNDDKPGFIGALGTILGDAGVNIANFNLGRVGPGEGAIALIDVDQSIGDDLLKKICALPHMRQAKSLSF